MYTRTGCVVPVATAVRTKFKDVSGGAYYAPAVYWALDNGITAGVAASSFGTGRACTRGQAVTFLWKYARMYP